MIINRVNSLCSRRLEETDKTREMMIASADYCADLVFTPVSELILNADSAEKGSRKRRLDHLSIEEKVRRKKLKNREAAQTSRDRKKAYVTNLEESVQLLQYETEALQKRIQLLEEENQKLKARNEKLENLKQGSAVSSDVPGPAVPPTPLPQGRSVMTACLQQVLPLHLLAMICLTSTLTGSVMLATQISKNSTNSQNPSTAKLLRPRKNCRQSAWWGPKQRAWNPPNLMIK